METAIFDGKQFVKEKEEALRERVVKLKNKGVVPKLVWICVGSAEQNLLYGRLKRQVAERVGIEFQQYQISNIKYQKELLNEVIDRIKEVNADPMVHGVMVQLPIQLSVKSDKLLVSEILSAIGSKKDVDCLTPENLGLVMMGEPRWLPATVRAVMKILNIKYKISNMRGKRVVVVGGGLEVGRPLVSHLSNLGVTVVWARSAEQNLKEITLMGDIVISAVGKPGLITGDMLKKGIIAIDVGSPKGDFEYESVKEKASFITPVPGGVGPVTVMSLMENVVDAAERVAD